MSENWYERNILPYIINLACGMKPILEQRMKIIPQAEGRVLEVGIGTGLNVPLYDRARVKSITGVDPSLRMHRLARKRIQASGIDVRLIGLSAETLPVDDESFDTVVCTYTLCTIPDPVAALKEMRRALIPGGKLLFSEHGRAPDADVLKWQTRVQPYWSKFTGGCQLDRDMPALLRAAGFKPTVQAAYIEGPKLLSYHYWGEAVPER
ncbi:MAG: phospholipid methyltransferase [Gammaproteobacteria bacterium RIFCSPLOWO2_02_FULL_61_13]|nr:MAG: phospholipid methyltransferase [Gammaproteobacteria bacterium RIFCSPLOWO2_02_FULL_61_13]